MVDSKLSLTLIALLQESQISAPSFTINAMPALAPATLIEALRTVVTPHLSDNLQRPSGVAGLRKFHKSRKLVGTALTVKARPGDVIVGDEDGIVSFPQNEADALLAAARRSASNEELIKAEIASGSVNQSWLTKVLAVHGLAD